MKKKTKKQSKIHIGIEKSYSYLNNSKEEQASEQAITLLLARSPMLTRPYWKLYNFKDEWRWRARSMTDWISSEMRSNFIVKSFLWSNVQNISIQVTVRLVCLFIYLFVYFLLLLNWFDWLVEMRKIVCSKQHRAAPPRNRSSVDAYLQKYIWCLSSYAYLLISFLHKITLWIAFLSSRKILHRTWCILRMWMCLCAINDNSHEISI